MAIVRRAKTGQLPPPAEEVPVEHYSKARVREFDKANRSSAVEKARVAKALRRRRR
jgi:hypothetical protein